MIGNGAIVEAARGALARLRPEQGGLREWIREYVLEPLGGWIESLLRFVASVGGGPLGTVLLWAVLAAAAALLVWLGFLLFRRNAGRLAREGRERVDRGTEAPFDPAAAEAEAARLAARGEFLEAVRLLYLATVAGLRRAAHLPFDPALTPAENLRPFRRAPFYGELREFVRGYEEASFGARPLDAAAYRRLESRRPGGAPR